MFLESFKKIFVHESREKNVPIYLCDLGFLTTVNRILSHDAYIVVD